MIITMSPRCNKAVATCDPMNPAPPVTSTTFKLLFGGSIGILDHDDDEDEDDNCDCVSCCR